jgi:hypothetical protein
LSLFPFQMARLRVDLDAVPKNRVPDWIEGHEHAPDELAVVEEDTHSHAAIWEPFLQRRRQCPTPVGRLPRTRPASVEFALRRRLVSPRMELAHAPSSLPSPPLRH